MSIGMDELKKLFQDFRWIDDIPEDQDKRDEICVEAKAALLLEANIDSEMMSAFLRMDGEMTGQCLPQPISFNLTDPYDKNKVTVITLKFFEFGKLNEFQKYWGPQVMPTSQSGAFSLKQ